ncbi:hypothetical protein BTVI_148401 [Pitangus sulphuratus]|nr:hypothetical protein BTVI_148401 [Pitangus sulphuratus]
MAAGAGRALRALSGGIVCSFLGDSFAVNASLARKGLEDWMVKQKYSGGSSSGGSSSGLQQGCQHRAVCRLSSARHSLTEGFSVGFEICNKTQEELEQLCGEGPRDPGRQQPVPEPAVVLGDKKPDEILGCIRKSVASKLRDLILPFSPGETHLKCLVQFWAPQDRRDMELLESSGGYKDDQGTGASLL